MHNHHGKTHAHGKGIPKETARRLTSAQRKQLGTRQKRKTRREAMRVQHQLG